MDFSGKVAAVTGAASGIGAAVARKLAAQGAHVVVADITDDAGRGVAKECGGKFVHCDVRAPEQLQSLFDGIIERHGRLDLLRNNAGRELYSPLLATEDEDFRELVRVNLDGVFHGVKHDAKAMLGARTPGAIVNTASVAGLRDCPLLGAYNATKGGVVLLTSTSPSSWRPSGSG